MFKFVMRKKLKSKLYLIVFIITSLFLINEFIPYFTSFPITSESKLKELMDYGVKGDFIPRIEFYEEEEQIEIVRSYFDKVIKEDTELTNEEKEFIIEEFINIKSMEDYDEIWNKLFDISHKADHMNKFEDYLMDLTMFGGKTYKDAMDSVEEAIEKENISQYLSRKFEDRQAVIWGIFIFLIVAFNYKQYNKKSFEEILYPKNYSSKGYVITHLISDSIIILLCTLLQFFVFAVLFHIHISDVYTSSLMDYINIYLIYIVPSILVLVSLTYLLMELIDVVALAFPIYYLLFGASISPNGFHLEINKIKLIIRNDSLFKTMTSFDKNIILWNRVIMLFLVVLFIILSIYLFYQKRSSKINNIITIFRK